MYKHSTTHRTLSRRMAALLAALALLAVLALPVYAEALDGATGTAQAESNGTTGTAQAEIEDTISDGTVTTENDSTTPEGKEAAKDSTANADGNNASENKDTNDNASQNTTGDSNTTADDAANDTPQILPDDNIDPTAGNTTTNDILDTMDEDAEQDIVTRSADDAETADEYFDIYFALPKAWEGAQKISFEALRGNHGDGSTGTKEMTLVDGRETTADGKKIYKINLHYKQGDTSVDCPYKGFAKITFTKDDDTTGISAKLTVDTNDSSVFWQEYETLKDRYYDSDKQEWISIAELKPRHTHFADKTFTFKNMTTNDLTNVQAIFYDKAEGSTELKRVKAVDLYTVSAKGNATVTIPNEACAYVAFFVDGVQLGNCFNFCNDDSTTENVTPFLYSESQNCFVYTTNGNFGLPEDSARKIYYDATFSKLSLNTKNAIPSTVDGKVYYYMYKSGNTSDVRSGEMTHLSDNLYSVDAVEGYDRIIFAAYINGLSPTNLAYSGNSTATLQIPSQYVQPCFYADTGDASMFNSFDGNRRDGYWAELGTFRNAEENKPGKRVVDISQAPFAADSQTKYINSTLYDYYSDWELNGNNRDDYDAKFNTDDGGSNTFANDANAYRNWVTFGQFDQALSDYYQKDGTQTVRYPMYTGQFQPAAHDYEDGQDKLWGFGFAAVADSLNLYGYSGSVNKFMAVNNSTININGTGLSSNEKNQRFYAYTFQGLTGKTLVDGNPVLYDTNLTVPYFNEDFLLKNNSKNAKLGEVYDNVSFPFTKAAVFQDDNEKNVQYWHFDSNQTTLYLKRDTGNNGYFLQNSDKREKSRNLKSNSNYQDPQSYGFFPFNEDSTEKQASTYNYGFGAKLQFQFTMNENGKVYGADKRNEVPIKFFFSGDDDVWVYIDGKLALDVGGDHGKASGLLEFGLNKKNELVYTPYVSDVKVSNTDQMYTKDSSGKSVKYLKADNTITFNYKGKEESITPGTHTLTMYYMERGMWESNMAVAFNFPDNNELQVQKEVDLSNVTDDKFKDCFKNQKIFNFTIQNQATHYGTKVAVGSDPSGFQKVDLTADGNIIAPATPDKEDEYIFRLDPNPLPKSGPDGERVLHWYARYTDTQPVSKARKQRYGKLTLNNPINIKDNMRFLMFQVYVDPKDNGGDLSLNNLYLELLDENGVQKGSLGTTGINGATYGSVELATGTWVTVKLDLHKMKEQDGFNGKVQTIRVGDNYSRNIYFRNFTFIPKAVPTEMTGFTTDQEKIPDYGSAKSGQLQNAENAQYTSNMDTDTQLVDENGRFVLEDGETVTFSDQFRRGSYISLKEDLNQSLYDTTWTVYENGQKVTSMKEGNSVSLPSTIPSLDGQKGSGPNDGRTEKKGAEEQNKYDGNKPSADTIVFRSYKDPDETSSTLTKLKVEYVNTVKTGGLKIQKKAAAGEEGTIKGTYTFKVTFNDVGGEGLEEKSIERTVTIDMGKGETTGTITGIPVGTRYTIEELTPEDHSRLQSVTVPDSCKSAHVISNNTMVEGVIVESKDPNDPEVTAIFTNTQRKLINIEFDKLWIDANDKDIGTTKQPDTIYIQLQRCLATSTGYTDWEPVNYPTTTSSNYVTISRGTYGWQYTFSNLDQYPIGGNAKNNYIYRIVEGTVKDGGFIPADGTITINGNTYVVKAEATPKSEKDSETGATTTPATATDGTITGGSGKIVLTNTLQNPKFNLDILKKSADEPDTPLKGVEFKLEKLMTDGKTVDDSFTARIGITNAQGEVKEKGSDGNATRQDIFHALEAGTYRLTETKAAKDYNLLSEPIIISFSKDGQCQVGNETPRHAEAGTIFTGNAADGYTLSLTVLNRKTPALPHTGADAPSLWLLIGLPLAVAGLLILVFRYNKKGGRTR